MKPLEPDLSPLVIEIRNDLTEISTLTDAVERYGARTSLAPDVVSVLTLSLDELVTNVISYGFDDEAEHAITVRIAVTDGQVVARVEDDGVAFNPLDKEEPDLDVPVEQRRVGGLGIHLVKTLMDEVTYAREGPRNVLTITKRLVADVA